MRLRLNYRGSDQSACYEGPHMQGLDATTVRGATICFKKKNKKNNGGSMGG